MLKVWMVIYFHSHLMGYISHPYDSLYLCYLDIDQITSKDHIDPTWLKPNGPYITCDVYEHTPVLN